MPSNQLFALDSFKQTFVDIKEHPTTMLIPSALLSLPILVAVLVASIIGGIALNLSLTFAGHLLVIAWLPVLIIRATHDLATGTDPGVMGLFEKSTNLRLFSYIGTVVLIGLMVLAGAIVSLLPTVIVVGATFQARGLDPFALFDGPQGALILICFLLGVFLFLGFTILIRLRYGLAESANVLEKVSPTASLGRSNALLKGHRGDFMLLLLTWFAISAILNIVVGGPAQVISFTSQTTFGADLGQLSPPKALIVALSTFLTTVVSVPLITGATTNFYLSIVSGEVKRLSDTSGGGSFASGYGEGYSPEQQQSPREDPHTRDLAEGDRSDQT